MPLSLHDVGQSEDLYIIMDCIYATYSKARGGRMSSIAV